MKLTDIQIRYLDVGLLRGGIFLLKATDGLRFVDECERSGINILGIDGFNVFGEKIQPLQEHSFDLYGQTEKNHCIAREFLMKRADLNIWFEIGISLPLDQ